MKHSERLLLYGVLGLLVGYFFSTLKLTLASFHAPRELMGLLMAHAVADFALQSDWMAKHKHPWRPVDPATVPPGQTPQIIWPYVMSAHGLIHGATVWIACGNPWFAAGEVILHCLIDTGKCANRYGIHVDQGLHLACKLVWWWF